MSHSSVLCSISFSTSGLSLLPLAQLRHISAGISSVPQQQSFVLCCDSSRGYCISPWNHALLSCHFPNPTQGTLNNSFIKELIHSCIKHYLNHVWSFMGFINNMVFCSYISDTVTERKGTNNTFGNLALWWWGAKWFLHQRSKRYRLEHLNTSDFCMQ